MIEVIGKELLEAENIRGNLIQLKQAVKDEDVLNEWKNFHFKHPVLFALLENEDAKVRKNAALLLGMTGGEGALQALYKAYDTEEKLFVRSSYLTAMSGMNLAEYEKELSLRYEELLRKKPEVNEQKHVQEELHALDSLLRKSKGVKKHRFSGYETPVEVLLTTNPRYREITAQQMKPDKTVLVSAGVKVNTSSLRKLIAVRTFRELLFILKGRQQVEADPEAAAQAFVSSNLLELLEELHEGEAPFYFRLEVRGRIDEKERTAFIHKTAARIEALSNHRLMNSADEYEIELRLTQNRDGMYCLFCKLFTIPMRRFAYRKHAVAASIHPATAALLAVLAEPYLKEDAQVLDPFCGVGTMLIERDMLVPAGDMYGTDIFGEAILKARENAEAAGRCVNYINRDFFDFTHKYLFDEIIANMPVRGRKTKEEQDMFYGGFFTRASMFLKPDGVMILYTNENGFVKKQLRLHKEYQLMEEYCIREKDGFYLFIIGGKR